MTSRFATGLVASLAAVSAAPALGGAGKFSLETGMDYNTGKYGGAQSTSILYVPVTAKYQGESWTLKVTVPYLRITGGANVALLDGTGTTAASANPAPARSGMGDVLVAATHPVYNNASGFFANATGKIKFATADATAGLGTGKNDYALQADLYQVSGDHTTFGSLGYRVYGSPPGLQLNNAFYGSLGVSYGFGPDSHAGIMLSAGQHIIATASSRLEALLFVNRRLTPEWRTQAYVLKGFTNSVPAWGAGATFAYLF